MHIARNAKWDWNHRKTRIDPRISKRIAPLLFRSQASEGRDLHNNRCPSRLSRPNGKVKVNEAILLTPWFVSSPTDANFAKNTFLKKFLISILNIVMSRNRFCCFNNNINLKINWYLRSLAKKSTGQAIFKVAWETLKYSAMMTVLAC